MTDYPKELRNFLTWCAPRLEEVLEARGAREVWLQAEAYRYFRFHRPAGRLVLATNAHQRNDLAFYATAEDATPEAVIEIKLFGLDYLTKNLTGYPSLAPYRRPGTTGRFTFLPRHALQCHPKESSLLKDYRKLLAQDGRRYLLLVLDTQRGANAFGDAIQCVDFGGPGRQLLRTKKCSATLWQVE